MPLGQAHTYENDRLRRRLGSFDGLWKGNISIFEKGQVTDFPASIKGYKITNGCALLLFIEYRNNKEIHLQTYNTTLQKWEESVLDNKPGTGMEVFHGPYNEQRIETIFTDAPTRKKYIWNFEPENNKISFELFN